MEIVSGKMIINKTQNILVSKQERVCSTSLSQMRGLMFRKRQNCLMTFPEERKVSLHMFFVFYPIDALLLDKNRKVVEIYRNLRPFRFWFPQKKAKYILEMAFPGKYKLGDVLKQET